METDAGPFGPYGVTPGSSLTAEQRRELDDVYFESNPAAYWRARIDSLVRSPEPVDYAAVDSVDLSAFGIASELLPTTEPTLDERLQQVALDAFALRHHLAESLARLTHAVLTQATKTDHSVWELMASSPHAIHQVVEQVVRMVSDEIPAGLLFMTPEHAQALNPPSEQTLQAMEVHWQWVCRALDLLTGPDLDANVAHNKFKHGFSLRQRDDVLLTVTRTAPDSDGNISKAALDVDAIKVLESTSVEVLAQVPKREAAAGSWEVTTLNLRTPQLLGESLMLCTVWTGVFASAAARHFHGRELRPPPHPGFVLGPPPERFMTQATGIRHPLTAPANGGLPRSAVLGFPSGLIPVKWTGTVAQGRVVE